MLQEYVQKRVPFCLVPAFSMAGGTRVVPNATMVVLCWKANLTLDYATHNWR